MSDKEMGSHPAPRKRSLTQMTLTWLAERMRKTERVKSALAKGEYRVDSQELARTIVTKVQ